MKISIREGVILGHLGFSYVGLLYLLLLFLPNLLWVRNKPLEYDSQSENPVLATLERVGQVCTTCCAVIFSDFNLRPWSAWSVWLVVSAALMVLYEVWWVRYFRSEKTQKDFYSSLLGIPVAGATLPVLAFLLLGIYGKVAWMILSAVVLGIGHIGIHLQHRRQLEG